MENDRIFKTTKMISSVLDYPGLLGGPFGNDHHNLRFNFAPGMFDFLESSENLTKRTSSLMTNEMVDRGKVSFVTPSISKMASRKATSFITHIGEMGSRKSSSFIARIREMGSQKTSFVDQISEMGLQVRKDEKAKLEFEQADKFEHDTGLKSDYDTKNDARFDKEMRDAQKQEQLELDEEKRSNPDSLSKKDLDRQDLELLNQQEEEFSKKTLDPGINKSLENTRNNLNPGDLDGAVSDTVVPPMKPYFPIWPLGGIPEDLEGPVMPETDPQATRNREMRENLGEWEYHVNANVEAGTRNGMILENDTVVNTEQTDPAKRIIPAVVAATGRWPSNFKKNMPNPLPFGYFKPAEITQTGQGKFGDLNVKASSNWANSAISRGLPLADSEGFAIGRVDMNNNLGVFDKKPQGGADGSASISGGVANVNSISDATIVKREMARREKVERITPNTGTPVSGGSKTNDIFSTEDPMIMASARIRQQMKEQVETEIKQLQKATGTVSVKGNNTPMLM